MIALVSSLTILFALNTIMVASTSPSSVFKQVLAWIIGLGWFWWGRQLSYKINNNVKSLIFISSSLLLFLPIFMGENIRGSSRWINFGPASFQPTELVKPWLMLFLANTSSAWLIIIPTLITALQPDLSSALGILLLALPCLLYSNRLRKLTLLALIVTTICSPLVWKFGLKSYQKDRVFTFLNPKQDTSGKGYNVIQSQIAIGSGGLFGKGFKQGTQIQLKFLPEKHTDFIFASLAEELGLVGVSLLVLAYYLLLKSLLDRLKQATSKEQTIFILGIFFHLWSQVIANIGMNIGILPVSGLPLPFISVGGSAIMAMLFALGIIHTK